MSHGSERQGFQENLVLLRKQEKLEMQKIKIYIKQTTTAEGKALECQIGYLKTDKDVEQSVPVPSIPNEAKRTSTSNKVTSKKGETLANLHYESDTLAFEIF